MKYDLVRVNMIILLVILLVSSTGSAIQDSSYLKGDEDIKTKCPLPLISPPVTIDKKVRINPNDPWQNSITAPIYTNLEFKISVYNTKITPKNVAVTDLLPTILDYIYGSADPEPDGYVNDTEEAIVWIINIPAWTTKTITYHAELVASGFGENYVHVVPLLPGQEPDEDIVPITGINNYPPSKPTVDGPISGNPGASYDYIFTATDPDGEDISYYIKWGDGSTTDWTDFQASGNPYSESHKWSKQGTYTIEAKAKDINGAESGWSTLIVTMPRYRIIQNTLYFRFLVKFPLLQRLLQ